MTSPRSSSRTSPASSCEAPRQWPCRRQRERTVRPWTHRRSSTCFAPLRLLLRKPPRTRPLQPPTPSSREKKFTKARWKAQPSPFPTLGSWSARMWMRMKGKSRFERGRWKRWKRAWERACRWSRARRRWRRRRCTNSSFNKSRALSLWKPTQPQPLPKKALRWTRPRFET